MNILVWRLVSLVLLLAAPASAQWVPDGADTSGPVETFRPGRRPSTPSAVKFNQYSRGTLLGKSKKVRRANKDVCDTLSYTFQTEVTRGKRRFAIEHNPVDCTARLTEVEDTTSDDSAPVALGKWLLDTLITPLSAQQEITRTATYDIWTCGINCLIDGLTAQQGHMSYKYVPFQSITMIRAIGWYCTAGTKIDAYTGKAVSNCVSPMSTPLAPMSSIGYQWWGQNPTVVSRVNGGAGSTGTPYISQELFTNFFRMRHASDPRAYEHTLIVQQYVSRNGNSICQGTFTGQILGAVLKTGGNCEVY